MIDCKNENIVPFEISIMTSPNTLLMLKWKGEEFDENYQKCQELGLQLPREIMSGQVKWDQNFEEISFPCKSNKVE